MAMDDLEDYVPPWQLVNWACGKLGILNDELSDVEIRKVMSWIGISAGDTMFIEGKKPVFGRIGIGLMLTVTLLQFPEYYVEYGLAQFN
jgi:hypothetical protein